MTSKTWIQTYSGRRYNLLDPNPGVLSVEDVAHALSQINRYTGHTDHPYSVAQHSVLAAEASWPRGHVWIEEFGCYVTAREFARQVVLHDAHEAVTGDVASPIKVVLGETWHAFEGMHEAAVRRRFGLRGDKMPRAVKAVDLRMLVTEKRDRMAPQPEDWALPDGVEPYDLTCRVWTPEGAERCFLALCDQLGIR